MIYTLGYAKLPPPRLLTIARFLDAPVIDVRRSARSRIRGYGPNQLRTLLNERYIWAGDKLGGGQVTAEGLDYVASLTKGILLCLEHPPGDCHRHHDIALPLERRGISIAHIFEDELVSPIELQRAIDEDDEYEAGEFRLVG
jgi:hypothetical protein